MLIIDGYCPICETDAEFHAHQEWYRDSLICQNCSGGSFPRERALALVLNETRPNWRAMDIHESSAADRGISRKLAAGAPGYVSSQYFPDAPFGSVVGNFRNEDLENLTFDDENFDITITLDVMEHIYHPDRVFREIHRTLRTGGIYICTFPVRKDQTRPWERRFERQENGTRIDLKEPEFHGNPVSDEGSIVTIDWGYDLHQQIPQWAPFDVRVHRFADAAHGILGEYTEVIVCRKRAEIVKKDQPPIPNGFNAETYIRLNPDLAAAGVSGVDHWSQHGRFEGRRWRD
jgi:SAM-dependent methyltransferase